MTLITAIVRQALDSTQPKFYVVNTLAFNVGFDPLNPPPGGTDYQKLADDLLALWRAVGNRATHSRVDIYNHEDDPPRRPRASAESNIGAAYQGFYPRQVALCLSFYATKNQPRRRGRLYLCPDLMGITASASRPSAADQTKALNLADALSGLGGVNVDWCVFSRSDNAFRKVTHAWVDDVWDTQRSRKLLPLSRAEKDVSG